MKAGNIISEPRTFGNDLEGMIDNKISQSKIEVIINYGIKMSLL